MTIDVELRPSDSLPPGVASLRFDATVPRGLVHRAAVAAETLLTDAAEVGDDRFVVAAQLPRGHLLYNEGRPGTTTSSCSRRWCARPDSGIASLLRRPGRVHLPLRRAQIEVTELDAIATSDVASQMIADIRIAGQERQSGTLASMTLDAALIVDGLRVGWAGGAIHFVSPSSYGTLRRNRPAADGDPAHVSVRRAEPHRVGRCDLRNVVVGELERPTGHGSYSCRIIADTRHPSFFDHPQDHIPGMLLSRLTGSSRYSR